MNIKKLFGKIGGGIAWPFKRISEEIGEEIAEKTAIAVRAVEEESPLLGAVMNGKPIKVVTETTVRFEVQD